MHPPGERHARQLSARPSAPDQKPETETQWLLPQESSRGLPAPVETFDRPRTRSGTAPRLDSCGNSPSQRSLSDLCLGNTKPETRNRNQKPPRPGRPSPLNLTPGDVLLRPDRRAGRPRGTTKNQKLRAARHGSRPSLRNPETRCRAGSGDVSRWRADADRRHTRAAPAKTTTTTKKTAPAGGRSHRARPTDRPERSSPEERRWPTE